jgi:hypothetical protein
MDSKISVKIEFDTDTTLEELIKGFSKSILHFCDIYAKQINLCDIGSVIYKMRNGINEELREVESNMAGEL